MVANQRWLTSPPLGFLSHFLPYGPLLTLLSHALASHLAEVAHLLSTSSRKPVPFLYSLTYRAVVLGMIDLGSF